MHADVSSALERLLSTNLGPAHEDAAARVAPDYGVTCLLSGSTLEVALTFRRGRAYCCMEWGCHLALLDGKRWTRLRDSFAAEGRTLPPRLRMRLTVTVEDGALFFDPFRPEPGHPGRYAFARSGEQRYEVETQEAPSR